MLRLLFQCNHCEQPPSAKAFPLCEDCLNSLIPCPPLCPHCASPECAAATNSQCLKPWAQFHERLKIKFCAAKYLLVGQGYSVLKKWKTHGGPLFDQKILQADRSLKDTWLKTQADWIIPIPQDLRRSWQLRRSPARITANWISRETGVQVLEALFTVPKLIGQKRQAELALNHRRLHSLQFAIHPEWKNPSRPLENKKILLVDDFMTTGHTLKTAAQELAQWGAQEVHLFCLGLRPAFVKEMGKKTGMTSTKSVLPSLRPDA